MSLLLVVLLMLLIIVTIILACSAAVAPPLGTAGSFAILGGSTVTNTGLTVVNGDLGVSPGSAITGFPPGVIVGGTSHANDGVAILAQSDETIAYNNLAGQSCDVNLTGQDLGGMTLTAGTYCFSSSAQLTGTLTLDGQGNPSATFIFQIGSTLTTASNAIVLMTNQASECRVYWQVGSSATLGTATVFAGNILALASITLNTGTTIVGRALAQTGAVTMDTNTISNLVCTLVPTVAPTIDSSNVPTTATPTNEATSSPTIEPSPTSAPSNVPTNLATTAPTIEPSPTPAPSSTPTNLATMAPTIEPSPTPAPTLCPTRASCFEYRER